MRRLTYPFFHTAVQNARVIEDLGYPAYVLCQLDAKNCVFAIRMCKSNETRGFKFSKPKGGQKTTVSISNKNLVEAIRAAMKGVWETDKCYRVRGFWVADAKTMCFDLLDGILVVIRKYFAYPLPF